MEVRRSVHFALQSVRFDRPIEYDRLEERALGCSELKPRQAGQIHDPWRPDYQDAIRYSGVRTCEDANERAEGAMRVRASRVLLLKQNHDGAFERADGGETVRPEIRFRPLMQEDGDRGEPYSMGISE